MGQPSKAGSPFSPPWGLGDRGLVWGAADRTRISSVENRCGLIYSRTEHYPPSRPHSKAPSLPGNQRG